MSFKTWKAWMNMKVTWGEESKKSFSPIGWAASFLSRVFFSAYVTSLTSSVDTLNMRAKISVHQCYCVCPSLFWKHDELNGALLEVRETLYLNMSSNLVRSACYWWCFRMWNEIMMLIFLRDVCKHCFRSRSDYMTHIMTAVDESVFSFTLSKLIFSHI